MPAYSDRPHFWKNLDLIRATKASLEEELTRLNSSYASLSELKLVTRIDEIKQELKDLQSLGHNPNIPIWHREAVQVIFNEREAPKQQLVYATSKAQSIDRSNLCISQLDDCPKFRIKIKNDLYCKDIEIKTIKITCTDSELPLSSKPEWLNDSSILTPEIKAMIETFAQVEFNNQRNGFTSNVQVPDVNQNILSCPVVEGNCTIYNTKGSFRKTFSHELCVDSNDANITHQLILEELDRLEAEQLQIPNTHIVESRKIDITNP
jgi:hypothetical protein